MSADLTALDAAGNALYAAGQTDGKAQQQAVDQATIDEQSRVIAADTEALALAQTRAVADAQTIADQAARIKELEDELNPPPPQRFAGDPGVNLLYYGESNASGDPTTREATFGHKVGIFRSYAPTPNVAASVAACKRDLAAGRLPLHSTKLPGSWADMAAGKFDATFVQPLMDGLASVGGPVWLCLHHEPYDDNPAGGPDYVAMYRHIYPMRPANVALVPILQSAPFDPTVYGKADIRPWYDPAACDIVGIDQYCHWSTTSKSKWRDPATMELFLTNYLAQFGKPIVVAEYGVRTDPASPGKAAAWLKEYHDRLVARGDVVGMSFFDSDRNVNDGGTPWTLDYKGDGTDGTERLNAFKALLTAAGSAYLT